MQDRDAIHLSLPDELRLVTGKRGRRQAQGAKKGKRERSESHGTPIVVVAACARINRYVTSSGPRRLTLFVAGPYAYHDSATSLTPSNIGDQSIGARTFRR